MINIKETLVTDVRLPKIESLFANIKIEDYSDINNISFSVEVNAKTVDSWIRGLNDYTINLNTHNDEYFEVTSAFLMQKRMGNRYNYRLIFNNSIISKLGSTNYFYNIFLEDTVKELISVVLGDNCNVNTNDVEDYLKSFYHEEIKLSDLQDVTKTLFILKQGMEFSKQSVVADSPSVDNEEVIKDSGHSHIELFKVVEGFDVSLHSFLITTIKGYTGTEQLYKNIGKWLANNVKSDVNINVNNYRDIIDSVCSSSELVVTYNNVNLKPKLIMTTLEALLITLELTTSNPECIILDIVSDFISHDTFNIYLPLINSYSDYKILNSSVKSLKDGGFI